jgi:HlyD family secretion protein
MRVRNAIVLIGLVAIAGAAYALYRRHERAAPEARYRTEAASRGAVAETVTATGTISAVTTVQVGSQVSGIIARLHADYNSPVRRGQLLAELDPTPFEAQVEQRRADRTRAEVQARAAEVAFRRSERLLGEKLLAEAEFDAARATYEAAVAQVDQAHAALRQSETNLSYTRIFSPIDGVVVARQYDVGQTVAASFQAPTLFTIAEDLTQMQVQADVDQSDISRIAVGQVARFTVDAYADETFEGTISQIRLNATQTQNVITYPVIADVANPGLKLRPQMTADVTIEVARVENALRVPNAALRFRPVGTAAEGAAARDAGPGTGGGGPVARAAEALGGGAPGSRRRQAVHILRDGGVLQAVPVRTGISDGRFTAILEGELQEGDPVAIGLATMRSTHGGSFPGLGGPGGGRRP